MKREITYLEALRKTLEEEMIRDERVFLIGEDIGLHGGVFGATRGLLEKFGPERVRNAPISEGAIVGAALGAALVGMRPVAEIMYMDFSTLAMDQIVNQAAKIRYMSNGKLAAPLVLRTQISGGRGKAGQHSQSLEAWFAHVPGLKVVMPSSPYDVKGLLKTAIRDDNPVIFLEHATLYKSKGSVPVEEYTLPIGVAEIKREGEDVTLVATSLMVEKALTASEELAKEGIEVEVVDPRSLVPFDVKTVINSVKKTGRLVIVHQAWKNCGFGAEVACKVMEYSFDYLDAPIKRIAGLDTPMPYARALEEAVLPGKADIIEGIRDLVGV